MELFDYQKEHVARLESILSKFPIALDTSPIGAGKTYTSLYLAKKYKFDIIVIGPKTMSSIWTDLSSEIGVKLINYISYQKLRSVKGKELKHDYLIRNDDDGQTSFASTPKWEKLIDHGVMLILDEIQLIKNTSDQYLACQTLCNSILKKGQYSRVLLLSGSPFDKEEHAVNLLRLMGFIENPVLSRIDKHTHKLELLGAGELIEKCRQINPQKVEYLLNVFMLIHQKMANFCYRLFIDIIKPTILSQMPIPPIDVEKDVKNGYYPMVSEEKEVLNDAIQKLIRASRYNRITDSADLKQTDWSAVTQALMDIETAKIPILKREIKNVLTESEHSKVVVFVQFTSTIHELKDALEEYRPFLLYGQTSPKDREYAIDQFQKNPEARLLIGNIRVGGVGISLHDTDGKYPRTLFVIPNYSLLDLHQATGRIYRQGSKSIATVRFVYGKLDYGMKEVNILNALARKTKVIKEILDIHSGQICFPGDYKEHIYL